ncbi:MAG: apolipoprotein N-acyltransferase [Verrucomicrobiota bacterium]
MKNLTGKWIRGRFAPAAAAGVLLALSFPNCNIAGFAWIAPALMLAAAFGKTGAESFRIGYVAGLAHHLVSLGWLLLIPYRWQGIPLGPFFGWLALSSYLALFPAAWVWLCLKAVQTEAKNSSEARPGSWLGTLRHLAARSWAARARWTLFCAATWVALEMILSRLLGGFPWNLLGSSQYQITPLIQLASLTGVYGVSFLVVWTSLSLLCAAAAIAHRPGQRSAWLGEVILPMLAVTTAFVFGFQNLRMTSPAEKELRVTLIQPSIPQTLIWDPANDLARFRELLRLSESALTNQTQLLIWPEAAIPKLLRYEPEIFQAVTNLARRHQVWMIVGSDDAEPRTTTSVGDADYFNSAFLVSPQGELLDRYNKRQLVIFGEYLPLRRWLPFLKWFTPIDGGFTPGRQAGRFSLENLGINISPLICYEDMFPQLTRGSVDGGVDLLVNLTNDGWFGEGAAQWQQAAGAVFRAVENGVPMVRCANNGVSGWIDASGNLRALLKDAAGTIYGPGALHFTLPLAKEHPPTFYHRHGDWFGWSCAGLSAVTAARRLLPERKKSS